MYAAIELYEVPETNYIFNTIKQRKQQSMFYAKLHWLTYQFKLVKLYLD